MTCNWVSQVATNPKLVATSVESDAVTAGLIAEGGSFSVSILARRSGQVFEAEPRGHRRRRGHHHAGVEVEPSWRMYLSSPEQVAIGPVRAATHRLRGEPPCSWGRSWTPGVQPPARRTIPRSSGWRTPDELRADRPLAHPRRTSVGLVGLRRGFGRRSMRSTNTPSSSAASASPSMAKSMKSAWACSLKRWRSAPSIGGRPRFRDGLGTRSEPCQHLLGIELLGHVVDRSGGLTRAVAELPALHL